MKAIKLFLKETMDDGTERLQSQLMIGTNSADFIRDVDGNLKVFGNGNKGVDFYGYKGSYVIVNNVNEMRTQQL